MKVALILVGLCALTLASSVPKWQQQLLSSAKNKYKISDKVVLKRQQDVLRLLRNVNQPNNNQDQVTIAQALDVEGLASLSIKPQVIEEFIEIIQNGMLPKGQIFSINYEQHLQQAIALFKMMYYAKDYETFYQVASWARQYINEGMFVYALSVAVVHRADTSDIVLPPIYEINPSNFLTGDTIQNVQKAKQLYAGLTKSQLQQMVQEEQRQIVLQQLHSALQKGQIAQQLEHGQQWGRGQQWGQGQQWGGLQQTGPQQSGQVLGESQIQGGPLLKHLKLIKAKLAAKHPSIAQQIESSQITPEQIIQQQIQQQISQNQQLSQQEKIQQLLSGQSEGQQQVNWNALTGGQTQQQQQLQDEVQKGLQPDNLSLQQLLEDELTQGQQTTGQNPQLVIRTNYSKGYLNQNTDQKLAYFTEDVGLNAFYYLYDIHNPFWMSGEDVNSQTERRGEQYYFIHQQLIARYYLERLSNGLGVIPQLNYKLPIQQGYNPSLTYSNGIPAPVRPNNAWVTLQHVDENDIGDSNYTDVYQLVKDYERRIRDAIDSGYVITSSGKKINLYETPKGIEILTNLIQGNADSVNNDYYGGLPIVSRHLLGNSISLLDQKKVVPAVLEQPETSLRDPVFFQLYKKIVSYVQKYKKYLPQYTAKDLYMPGVEVQNVQVDRLITYFDDFDIDVTNALVLNKQEYETQAGQVQVRQPRLNHKPFTYAITVNSDKTTNAVVRVFIGPKTDQAGRQINLNANRLNFVQIDKFVQTLNVGQNVIQRNSRQSYWAPDRTSTKQLYKRVMAAYNSAQEMQLDGSEISWGLPQRLLLPKGTVNGQVYQLYVIVTPAQQTLSGSHGSQKSVGRGFGVQPAIQDGYPLGYPFDRSIVQSQFNVPNSYMKDIVIYHKSAEDIVS